MTRGQATAERLNDKYREEEDSSFLQSYYRKHPLAKMATSMARLPLSMAAGMIPGGGMLAAAGNMGIGGLLTSSNKQRENRRIEDYQRAKGTHQEHTGQTSMFNDPMRSMGNAVGSTSNPLMMAFLASQALSMTGLPGSEIAGNAAPWMLQGSMAARSPLMALQMAAGHGLTGALAGSAGATTAVDALTKTAAEHGTAGSIGLGSALLPSTLGYAAGGALKGAGALASGLGASTVGEGLSTGGGLLSGGSDKLIELISSAASEGGLGMALGPGLGILTSMALQKPMGKVMNSFREKSTGVQLQKKGNTIRPRVSSAGQLIKQYSMTKQLDTQVMMLGNTGQLKPFEWMVLTYLGTIEKPLSLMGFMAEEMQKKSEMGRVGGNKTQNALQSRFGFTGDEKIDLTKKYIDPGKRGIGQFFGRNSTGKLNALTSEPWENAGENVKATLSRGFLGLEKKALQASAIANPMGWILGGKHSVGSKLKDIREKDISEKATKAVSQVSGIPVSGITAMETTAVALSNTGETIDDKKLAIMGGTYELIRMSTFFLEDIRKALGVTEETSMIGKLDEVKEEAENRADSRTGGKKFEQGVYDVIDKIPVISVIGSLFGIGSRLVSRLDKSVTNPESHLDSVAEDILVDHTGVVGDADKSEKYLKEIKNNTKKINKKMVYNNLKARDNLTYIKYSHNTLVKILSASRDTAKYLKYLKTCPCNKKPKMALGGSFDGVSVANAPSIKGQVPGPGSTPGTDNVSTLNVALKSKEFVVSAKAAQDPGNKDLLTALNENRTPGILDNINQNIVSIYEEVKKITAGASKSIKPKMVKSSGSADATDNRLEAEQVHEEKVEREKKMTDSVVNIEKILKKCCKEYTKNEKEAKKNRKKLKGKGGDSFAQGMAESVVGSLGAAGIVAIIGGIMASPLVIAALVAGAGLIAVGAYNYYKAHKNLVKNREFIKKHKEVKAAKEEAEWEDPNSEKRMKFQKKLDNRRLAEEKRKTMKESVEYKNASPEEKRELMLKANQEAMKHTNVHYNKKEQALIEAQKEKPTIIKSPPQKFLAENPQTPKVTTHTFTVGKEPNSLPPEERPHVKQETTQDIKSKTEPSVTQAQKIKEAQKKEEENKRKEREEKNISLNEDIANGIHIMTKQNQILAQIISDAQIGSNDLSVGIGEVMTANLKELRKISGSSQATAEKMESNKNNIVQRA